MSRGIGANLFILGGGTENNADKYYGRKIIDAEIKPDEDDGSIFLTFEDGVKIKISDEGRRCCESRYMKTDDDVKSLIGGVLNRMGVKDAPNIADEYGEHEVSFLEIETNKGQISVASHNEHNGYYGGICLGISEVKT